MGKGNVPKYKKEEMRMTKITHRTNPKSSNQNLKEKRK